MARDSREAVVPLEGLEQILASDVQLLSLKVFSASSGLPRLDSIENPPEDVILPLFSMVGFRERVLKRRSTVKGQWSEAKRMTFSC